MLTITIRAVGTFCEMLRAASGPLSRRHPHVQQDYVRLVESGEVDCLITIGSFGDHLKLIFALEEKAQTAAHQRMIVGNHYPDAGSHINSEYKPGCGQRIGEAL